MPSIASVFNRIILKYNLGLLLENGDIDALAAGTITSAKWLANSNWGSGHFQGLETIVHRPGSATAADNIRYATSVTSAGVLSVDRNYSDTTLGSEYARLLFHGLHAQWVYDAINRGLRRAHFQNQIYVSLAADADM